jgi:hypothetical protein
VGYSLQQGVLGQEMTRAISHRLRRRGRGGRESAT